jgi:hypothetical protein
VRFLKDHEKGPSFNQLTSLIPPNIVNQGVTVLSANEARSRESNPRSALSH